MMDGFHRGDPDGGSFRLILNDLGDVILDHVALPIRDDHATVVTAAR